MRKRKESDQTLTTPVIDGPDEMDNFEEKKPRVRSGVFGIISISSALLLFLVTIINPFHTSGQFHLETSTDLTINLKLSSKEFLVITSKNVCNGIGSVPGISNSFAIVQASNLNERVAIGSGQLNDKGECEYVISVPTSESFKGGSVNFSFKFPFGKSQIFSINVGNAAPYKIAVINIPFD